MKRTTVARSVLLLFALGTSAFADDDPANEAAAKQLKALQGMWKVVQLSSEGQTAPANAIKPMRWVIRGKEVTFIDPNVPKGEDKSTFTIDSSKSPKAIDMKASGGPHKGKTLQGIYEIKEGRLKVCLRDHAQAAKGRPKKFEGNNGLGLIIFERVEKK